MSGGWLKDVSRVVFRYRLVARTTGQVDGPIIAQSYFVSGLIGWFLLPGQPGFPGDLSALPRKQLQHYL